MHSYNTAMRMHIPIYAFSSLPTITLFIRNYIEHLDDNYYLKHEWTTLLISGQWLTTLKSFELSINKKYTW